MKISCRRAIPLNILVFCSAFAAVPGCVSKGTMNGVSQPEVPKNEGVPVEVSGLEARAAKPVAAGPKPIGDSIQYDVIIVGGGVAGLTSALYLTDGGKKVLLLEPGTQLGASSIWSEGREHSRQLRESVEILKHIGVGSAQAQSGEVGSNYLVRGHYFTDLWSAKTLAKLPASYQVLAFELARAVREHKIPSPPFEEFVRAGGAMDLDTLSAEAWVQSLPKTLEIFAASGRDQHAEARKLTERFMTEMRLGNLAGPTGMSEVAEFVDSYCRQNFGAPASDVSAMAFAGFYAGEIEGKDGKFRTYDRRGDVIAKLVGTLENRALIFWAKTEAPVTSIGQNARGVEVFYNQGAESHRVTAKYVIFTDSLASAPDLIESLPSLAAAQATLMKSIRPSHLLEHEMRVGGHPVRAGSEIWLRASEPKASDPLSLELWRWPVPATVLPAKKSVMESEIPKTESFVVREVYGDERAEWSDSEVKGRASAVAARTGELLGELPNGALQGAFTVQKIASQRWPYATHAPRPGFFTEVAVKLRKPFGRVFFASNALGVPSLEEALFRGHCAAGAVLKRINKAYSLESWSRCPIDQEP